MTKIYFPRPPLKIRLNLDNFYHKSTTAQRIAVVETYDGIYAAIQTALHTSIYVFGLYNFDTTNAIDNIERVCEYALVDVLSFDYELSNDELRVVLAGMVNLMLDVYVAINTYAQNLKQEGYIVQDLADLIGEVDWGIYTDSPLPLDDSEDICLVIDQSVTEWATANRRH